MTWYLKRSLLKFHPCVSLSKNFTKGFFFNDTHTPLIFFIRMLGRHIWFYKIWRISRLKYSRKFLVQKSDCTTPPFNRNAKNLMRKCKNAYLHKSLSSNVVSNIAYTFYRVFRKNCVFSQFTAIPPSPTSL